MRGAKRLSGLDLDVGLDARAFPVGLGDRVDRTAGGHPDAEMIRDSPHAARVRAASRGFANDGRTLEVLQVVGEFFGG